MMTTIEQEHRSDGAVLAQHDRFYLAEYQQIVNWLNIQSGQTILDAGCGGGGMSLLLAQAVGETGNLVALDLAADLLHTTQTLIRVAGFESRVTYWQADVCQIPQTDVQFDLVWSSRVIHGLADPLAGLIELSHTLKPNGHLALGEGGVALRFLPFDLGIGEPGLEDRLLSLRLRRFATWREQLTGRVSHGYGWLTMLQKAGFKNIKARTFFIEQIAPFSDNQKSYMLGCLSDYLDMEEYRFLLTKADAQVLKELVNPHSPHWLFNRTDLHILSGSTVWLGQLGT